MQPRKLEHYKYFQPIAWTLCVSFAGFVAMLALQLENQVRSIGNLETSAMGFDQRIQNLENIVGVDSY
jgi:hypothetical protein